MPDHDEIAAEFFLAIDAGVIAVGLDNLDAEPAELKCARLHAIIAVLAKYRPGYDSADPAGEHNVDFCRAVGRLAGCVVGR